MTRGGAAKNRQEPERRCIATGEVQPKAGLIRFVASPDGEVVPDLAGKLPGRGIWVSADRAALEKAAKRNLFARSARTPLRIPDGLVDNLEKALAQRLIELISLSRKAGHAVAGYEKTKSWLDTGEAQVLIQASDGSARGKSKLRPPEGRGAFIGVLDASELGLAFGREHVIHGALAAGGLTARVVDEAARLSGVRGTDGGMAARKDD